MRTRAFALGLLFAFAGCSGCAKAAPPLLQGLPTEFKSGEAELQRRLETQFPLGSSEDRLLHALEAQGFRPRPGDGNTRVEAFERRDFPCTYFDGVKWTADAGRRITSLKATHGAICP